MPRTAQRGPPTHKHGPQIRAPSCPHSPAEPGLWGSSAHLVPAGQCGGASRGPLNAGLAVPPLACPPVPQYRLQCTPLSQGLSARPPFGPWRFPACPQLLCPLSIPAPQLPMADSSGPHHPTQHTCHHWSLRSEQVSAVPHRVLTGTEVAAMPVSTGQEEMQAQRG